MTIRTINLSTGEVTERELSAEELAALPVPQPPTPVELLAALERDYTLTQRNLRELILLTVEALKVGAPVDLSVLPGVQVVAAVEAEAAALRAQL